MGTATVKDRKRLIEADYVALSVGRQCGLVNLARSSFYYQPCQESAQNLALMRRIDQLHLDDPTKGGFCGRI